MILITGASSGIGEACAYALAEKKNDLILIARRIDRLNEIAEKIKQKHHVKVLTFELDITKQLSVNNFFNEQVGVLSQVSTLINNAGLAKGFKSFEDLTTDEWNIMIDTNIKSLIQITQKMLKIFKKNNKGYIVNLGSVAGHSVYPKGNVYCATKHAVHALSQSLRMDLCGTNIRVTEISPGMVETEFSVVRFGDQAQADQVYAGMKPLTAKDVADAVAWCIERPEHVNVQEIILYPTDQASTTQVFRKL